MKPMEPMKPMDFGPSWWPDDLGEPSTSGAQDGARYAFFPRRRRLLVERDGKLTTYDTGEHQISGVSQGSSHPGSPVFSSQSGEVKLGELKRVD
jgi:hypothetical protein